MVGKGRFWCSGCATVLVLPHVFDREDLVYFSEECPALKLLVLTSYSICNEHKDIFPGLLVKWKNLEFLTIGYCSYILEVLELIHIHLPKFIGLCIKDTEIDDVLASAIVAAKKLECLDVRSCTGFAEDDEEILKLSSGIKNFWCDGSKSEKDRIDILEISLEDFHSIIMDSVHIESDLDILYHSWN
ncbi:hypothetical protein POM88_003457 [Heracleum sosnowskyi]|uniref:Uncharacterized protein n=1 Tax=Heracleum sosnowskyi TaxID=360622 RepID=A0AAD8JGE3_9APIA|nr:hypothetical protein POM88_003457 [Heracleum sosnowskyi]